MTRASYDDYRFFHRDFINQFLAEPLEEGARIGDIVYDNVHKLHIDLFSLENRKLAEQVARVFYCSAGFDKGTPPNFFASEFTTEASLFLARVYAAQHMCNTDTSILQTAVGIHNSFINAWLRARIHGEQNSEYDALCKPWSCIGSAIHRVEDLFIARLVRDMVVDNLTITSGTYHSIADKILEKSHDHLKRIEPMLCAGLH
jgi:hypothetical protein